jgi:dipeptidyl aminopeptidase/acylaminoacyl peptidase
MRRHLARPHVDPVRRTPILGQVNGGRLVAGFTADGTGLYMVSWRGSDTTRLVRVDAATGREQETLAHDPKCDLWGARDADRVLRYRILFHPQTGALQAVAFQDMKVEWKAIDPELEKDFAALRAATAPAQFFVNSRDRADRTWIVATARGDGPTSYFLYDRGTRRLQHLFDDFPELRQLTLAPVEERRIEARDGVSLPCYLTLPPGVPARQLPLVLNVHGGPWARDGWFYDPMVQWLANRGYAVLQVEFRGSMGFGKKFLNIGDRQWGGTMQNDLTDAVRWAVQQGIADPKRVAIMGGSYGGYATLAGLAFTPELYACGVDLVGLRCGDDARLVPAVVGSGQTAMGPACRRCRDRRGIQPAHLAAVPRRQNTRAAPHRPRRQRPARQARAVGADRRGVAAAQGAGDARRLSGRRPRLRARREQ